MKKIKVERNRLLVKDNNTKITRSVIIKKTAVNISSLANTIVINKNKRKHIVKRDSGWAIKQEGTTRAAKVYPSKEEAVKAAQEYREQGYEIIIHKNDGSIEKWLKSKTRKQ